MLTGGVRTSASRRKVSFNRLRRTNATKLNKIDSFASNPIENPDGKKGARSFLYSEVEINCSIFGLAKSLLKSKGDPEQD